MRTRTILSLLGLNLCLLGAQALVSPSEAIAQYEIIEPEESGAWVDCCKKNNSGTNFCCDECCWSDREGCDNDGNCTTTSEQ